VTNIDKASLTVFIILILSGIGFIVMELKSQVEFWYGNYQFQKDRYDYYFNGANKRGLLDICKNADGELTVLFKEDCKI